MADHYDVAIVGASIAGCTAATLYARAGLKIALIERDSSLDAYKKPCTHYIQASATPTIQRLGLAERIEAAGGMRNCIDLWTHLFGKRHIGVLEFLSPLALAKAAWVNLTHRGPRPAAAHMAEKPGCTERP